MEYLTVLECEIELARGNESKNRAQISKAKKYLESSSLCGYKVLCVLVSERASGYVPRFLFGHSNWEKCKKKTPTFGVVRYEGVQIVLEGLAKEISLFSEFSVPGGLLNVLDARNVSTRRRKELKVL